MMADRGSRAKGGGDAGTSHSGRGDGTLAADVASCPDCRPATGPCARPRPTPAVSRAALSDPFPLLLVSLIAIQSACGAVFLADVMRDYSTLGGAFLADWQNLVELLAAVSLVIGIALEGWFLTRLLQRHQRSQRSLTIASGALHEVIEGYFRRWSLTPAEADVAHFTLKGLSIAEVAALRGSRDGTIKTHLNAIYRKSGVSGRGQLVSLLIEDLMDKPLVPPLVPPLVTPPGSPPPG